MRTKEGRWHEARSAGILSEVADPGPDWVVLPWSRSARWFLPREPPEHAKAGLSVYHPVTFRSRAGWEAARALASRGWFRVGKGSCLIPREVWDAAGHLVPEGGGLSVSRANHPGRFLALVFDRSGRSVAFVKVARDTMGSNALATEREALERSEGLLRGPLIAPKIMHHSEGILVFESVEWHARSRPWRLPEKVASALGAFFRSTASEDGTLGTAHGDFAPWNLLRTDEGWALVDWESSRADAPPFFDLFHYLVQSNSELRRPTRRVIVDGLRGRGWVGAAIGAYADGAQLDPRTSASALRTYLTTTAAELEPGVPGRSARVRANLLEALDGLNPTPATA